jgi:hypothetical protein
VVLFEQQENVYTKAHGKTPISLKYLYLSAVHDGPDASDYPVYQASPSGITPITDWFTCKLNGETALVLEAGSRNAPKETN